MKPAARTHSPRYQALLQLLRTADTIWNASRVFFARWDLRPSQFNVLNLIVDRPDGLTQIELSRRLLMHRSNLTGLVDRLEDRGLVWRKEDPADRRSSWVVLRPAGRKLVERILPHYHRAAEEVLGNLSVEEASELAAALVAVTRRAQEMAAELTR